MSKIKLTVSQKGTSFIIIDSLGYFCGMYATEAEAMAAAPKIQANVNRGFVHSWLLKPVYQNRKQSSQLSKNNSTRPYSNKTRNK